MHRMFCTYTVKLRESYIKQFGGFIIHDIRELVWNTPRKICLQTSKVHIDLHFFTKNPKYQKNKMSQHEKQWTPIL